MSHFLANGAAASQNPYRALNWSIETYHTVGTKTIATTLEDSSNRNQFMIWETDFYTPLVLRDAAFFNNSAPAVYENPVP